MLTRRIGKLLRGNASPFQIISACVLGFLIGMLPSFGTSPGLYILWLFLLIILNANLFLGGLCLLLGKIIYLAILPVLFKIGVPLIEGPLNGLIAFLANAPVTAWFGFEYYTVFTGQLLALILGLVCGVYLSKTLRGFRRKMASLEEGSERYQRYASKFWVKALAWVFLGGLKGKKDWKDLSSKESRRPVRFLGIALVVFLCILGYIGIRLLDTQIVTGYARDALADVNGATVDLEGVDISATENRVKVRQLAMANPEALDQNRFEVEQVVADISGWNLLAKKLVLDNLEFINARTGTPRKISGKLTKKPSELPPEPQEPEDSDAFSIYDVVENGALWKERLDTVKRVYDKVAPYMKSEEEPEDEEVAEDEDAEPVKISWRQRLEERAQEQGYSTIASKSVIRGAPRLHIRNLQAEPVKVYNQDMAVNIIASNLTSNPLLIEERGNINIQESNNLFSAVIDMPGKGSPDSMGIEVKYPRIEVAQLAASAKDSSDFPLEGGYLEVEGSGSIVSGVMDLPLQVRIHESQLSAFGTTIPADNLPLSVRVYGPIESPKIKIPRDTIEDLIKEGGKQKVKDTIEEKAGEKLKDLFNFGG